MNNIVKEINIVTDNDQALERAIQKWIRFQKSMWLHITDRLEKTGNRYNLWGTSFRVIIVVLSATITTISDIDSVPRLIITILAGILTALAGLEGFFKFLERRSELQLQQREIQAKRDELRYEWMVDVEIQTDFEKRMQAAKRLLEEGPQAFNDILNKHAFKSKEGASPTAS